MNGMMLMGITIAVIAFGSLGYALYDMKKKDE
jgi:hypothetical protein